MQTFLHERAEQSIVCILSANTISSKSRCNTGFFISPRLVLTTSSAAYQPNSTEMMPLAAIFPDNRLQSLDIVKVDTEANLLLLKLEAGETSARSYLPIANALPPKKIVRLYGVSFNWETPGFSFHQAKLQSAELTCTCRTHTHSPAQGGMSFLLKAAWFQATWLGAPVVDTETGEVLAVARCAEEENKERFIGTSLSQLTSFVQEYL